MNYGEIEHEDRRGGGSDNGGVCIVGGALVVRALGAAITTRSGAILTQSQTPSEFGRSGCKAKEGAGREKTDTDCRLSRNIAP